MLYFIPAWYQDNQWRERSQQIEFDDTVKQIQLFQRNQVYPYQLLLLSYAPNFRHFLHRQGVLHASYWSAFDTILDIKRKRQRVFSFSDLDWPENVEFIYLSTGILARVDGESYAKLKFGEDGNLIQIDLFERNQLVRRNLYDDRGFVSSTILYQNENPYREDFLTEEGKCKLSLFYGDGHVELNPDMQSYQLELAGETKTFSFAKQNYESLAELIEEVTLQFVENTSEKDYFCGALHPMHLSLLKHIQDRRQTLVSLFADRFLLAEKAKLSEAELKQGTQVLKAADYVITDSEANQKAVEEILGCSDRIRMITPFDTRVDFGISKQLPVENIMVPIDDMEKGLLMNILSLLGSYLQTNEKAKIHLFTRQPLVNQKEALTQCLEASISQIFLRKRFVIDQCLDELSISKCMREQRLLVDLRPQAELYLQILAISMGLPQIMWKENEYIRDGANGKVLKKLEDLPQILDDYLNGWRTWNEAMVAAYELGKEYTTQQLLGQWRSVIEDLESN